MTSQENTRIHEMLQLHKRMHTHAAHLLLGEAATRVAVDDALVLINNGGLETKLTHGGVFLVCYPKP
jgi:hypothetical protein